MRRLVAVIPGGRLGLRDRALLTLGWSGAFRRSELVALDVVDVARTPKGLVVLVRHSKTDQDRRGEQVPVFFANDVTCCPVHSVDAWLAAAGITYDSGADRGDEQDDLGYERFNIGWHELDQLARVLDAIEDKHDVEDLVRAARRRRALSSNHGNHATTRSSPSRRVSSFALAVLFSGSYDFSMRRLVALVMLVGCGGADGMVPPADGASADGDAPTGDGAAFDASMDSISLDSSADVNLTDCLAKCEQPGIGKCDAMGVCVITCNTGGSCNNGVQCPAGIACRIDCGGVNSCSGGLDCTQSTGCTINCAAGACNGKIDCKGPQCDINCLGGGACGGPIQCDSPTCNIECTNTNTCRSSIQCSGTTCTVDCAGGGACKTIDCTATSTCTMKCGGGGSCGGLISCTNGNACNMTCNGINACLGGACCKDVMCTLNGVMNGC